MIENTRPTGQTRVVSDRTLEQRAKLARRREKRRKQRIRKLIACVLMCVFAIGSVLTVTEYIQVTELKAEVEEKQTKLAQLDSEYISLNARKENSVSLSKVENYAENVLGLVKLDRSQEEYLELQKTDCVQVNEASSSVEKLASDFVKSCNAILSFLR